MKKIFLVCFFYLLQSNINSSNESRQKYFSTPMCAIMEFAKQKSGCDEKCKIYDLIRSAYFDQDQMTFEITLASSFGGTNICGRICWISGPETFGDVRYRCEEDLSNNKTEQNSSSLGMQDS